jgi:hypothetical protein
LSDYEIHALADHLRGMQFIIYQHRLKIAEPRRRNKPVSISLMRLLFCEGAQNNSDWARPG